MRFSTVLIYMSQCSLRSSKDTNEELNKKCKCKFNVRHRECFRDHPSQRLMTKCLTIIQIKLDLEMLVFEERGKPEYPEKHLSGQGREPTTNSTHTLVGGERSHHCAIPAPPWLGSKQLLASKAFMCEY